MLWKFSENQNKEGKMETDHTHPVFEVDPRINHALINKYVEVNSKSCQVKGFLTSADPVSQSIIVSICTPSSKNYKFRIIPGSSITDITEIIPPVNVEPPNIVNKTTELTSRQLEEKRKKIAEWLCSNLLPVSVEGDVINVYNGQLLIHPPYQHTDCITDNSIVLARMQHLLRNVPEK